MERVMPDLSMSFQFNFSSAVATTSGARWDERLAAGAAKQCPVFLSRPGLAVAQLLMKHGGGAFYSACRSLSQNGYGNVGTNSPSTQGNLTIKRSANRHSPPVRMRWSNPLLHNLLHQLHRDLHRLLDQHCQKGTQVDPRQASEALWAELLCESAPPFVKLEQVEVFQRVFVRIQLHDSLAEGVQGSALIEACEDAQERQATLPPRDETLASLQRASVDNVSTTEVQWSLLDNCGCV